MEQCTVVGHSFAALISSWVGAPTHTSPIAHIDISPSQEKILYEAWLSCSYRLIASHLLYVGVNVWMLCVTVTLHRVSTFPDMLILPTFTHIKERWLLNSCMLATNLWAVSKLFFTWFLLRRWAHYCTWWWMGGTDTRLHDNLVLRVEYHITFIAPLLKPLHVSWIISWLVHLCFILSPNWPCFKSCEQNSLCMDL